MTEQRIGTMEDVGDTYPVCDTCGHVGELRTKDGDECPKCEMQEASNV